jgi:hypothetical protein
MATAAGRHLQVCSSKSRKIQSESVGRYARQWVGGGVAFSKFPRGFDILKSPTSSPSATSQMLVVSFEYNIVLDLVRQYSFKHVGINVHIHFQTIFSHQFFIDIWN